MMNKERELLRRAKNNLHGAKLCSINSMSSRGEMLRLIDEAIKGIDEFLASEPERKPIPIDQIDKAYENTLYLDGYFAFGAGVRFAERHHGIGGEG